MRFLYLMGGLYTFICGSLVWYGRQPAPVVVAAGEPSHPVVPWTGAAGDWFQAIKPYCNALEVETHLRYQPPPTGAEGAGYGAACYALAGRIDAARALITALPGGGRGTAASIVFNIGHPVADAGDDRSAGPIMELVLEFWPDNYMALYHAGMSEYVLGQHDLAKRHLNQFLELYHENDGWRQNAIEVLGRYQGPER